MTIDFVNRYTTGPHSTSRSKTVCLAVFFFVNSLRSSALWVPWNTSPAVTAVKAQEVPLPIQIRGFLDRSHDAVRLHQENGSRCVLKLQAEYSRSLHNNPSPLLFFLCVVYMVRQFSLSRQWLFFSTFALKLPNRSIGEGIRVLPT